MSKSQSTEQLIDTVIESYQRTFNLGDQYVQEVSGAIAFAVRHCKRKTATNPVNQNNEALVQRIDEAIGFAMGDKSGCALVTQANLEFIRQALSHRPEVVPIGEAAAACKVMRGAYGCVVWPTGSENSLPPDGTKLYTIPPDTVPRSELADVEAHALLAIEQERLARIELEAANLRIAELQAKAVPDGWQLVPIESTGPMVNAGWDSCDGIVGTGTIEMIWDTMIANVPQLPDAAAPAPAASPVVPDGLMIALQDMLDGSLLPDGVHRNDDSLRDCIFHANQRGEMPPHITKQLDRIAAVGRSALIALADLSGGEKT